MVGVGVVLGVGGTLVTIAGFLVWNDLRETPAERRQEIEDHCFVLGGSPAERWIDQEGALAVSTGEATYLAWVLDEDDPDEAVAARALSERIDGPQPSGYQERRALLRVATWQHEHCDGVATREPLSEPPR